MLIRNNPLSIYWFSPYINFFTATKSCQIVNFWADEFYFSLFTNRIITRTSRSLSGVARRSNLSATVHAKLAGVSTSLREEMIEIEKMSFRCVPIVFHFSPCGAVFFFASNMMINLSIASHQFDFERCRWKTSKQLPAKNGFGAKEKKEIKKKKELIKYSRNEEKVNELVYNHLFCFRNEDDEMIKMLTVGKEISTADALIFTFLVVLRLQLRDLLSQQKDFSWVFGTQNAFEKFLISFAAIWKRVANILRTRMHAEVSTKMEVKLSFTRRTASSRNCIE